MRLARPLSHGDLTQGNPRPQSWQCVLTARASQAKLDHTWHDVLRSGHGPHELRKRRHRQWKAAVMRPAKAPLESTNCGNST
jgi:hypothetical protein